MGILNNKMSKEDEKFWDDIFWLERMAMKLHWAKHYEEHGVTPWDHARKKLNKLMERSGCFRWTR